MSLDQHLHEALRRAADAHVPPSIDLAGVVGGGRRRRRRRDLRRGAVAAACLVVVAGVPFVSGQLDDEAVRPSDEVSNVARVTDLTVGAAPDIPYCPGDGTIIVAGDAVDARCDLILHRDGTTLYVSPRGVHRLVDGEARLLDRRTADWWFPALSHDGRWAAWITEDTPDGSALLLGHDLVEGTDVEVPWPPLAGWVAGIDDLGRVFFQDFTHGDILMHDLRTGDTTPVTEVPDHGTPSIKLVTEDGFALLTDHDGLIEGSVTADGTFTQQHPADHGWGTTFSPDRSLAVTEQDGHLVVSPLVGDGKAVPLQLPREGAPVWFPVWEDSDSLLVQFDPWGSPEPLAGSDGSPAPASRTWLLRCEVTDGSCEVALRPGWGDRMSGPVYR